MSSHRLSLALEKGLFDIPDGSLGLWNAPADVPRLNDDTRVSQAFAPTFEHLKKRAFDPTPTPDGQVASSVVFCHRSRDATLDLLAQTFRLTHPDGLIIVDGNKTDGIEAIVKQLRGIAPDLETWSKAHGKIVWLQNPGSAPASWNSDWMRISNDFETWPGIFSADGVDNGSALLTAHLPALRGHVADLGAGWGYLSHHVLQHSPSVSALTLIEADFHATRAAQRNIADDRAEIIWADVHTHEGRYDAILCNPPFHTSRKPDPEIGRAFIETAARLLEPKGTLWLVANQTLPYEATLRRLFKKVETIAQTTGFKVFSASYPQGSKASRKTPAARVT